MLTAIGLALNFIGSIVLLGSDVKIIERILKQVDPVHYVNLRGLKRIIDKSMAEDIENDNRAHPYDRPVSADDLSLWPIRRFLQRHVEQDIPSSAEIDIRGGWFKVDGEQLTFPEERIIQLSEKEQLTANHMASLNAIYGLLYEARVRRIYIYGVCLLAIGFLIQLIDSLGMLSTSPP